MDIKSIYEDPQVVAIENKILMTGTHKGYVNEHDFDELFRERSWLLNRAFEFNDANAKLMRDFNECLRKALTDLYHKTHEYFQTVAEWNDWKNYNVWALLKLGDYPGNYPPLHPVQTERRREIWEIMSVYDDYYVKCGINGGDLAVDVDDKERESLMYFLYLNEEVDNWNERLPRDWSKDMNLLHGFHNLYDHTWFSLYDFLFVREFTQEFEFHVDR